MNDDEIKKLREIIDQGGVLHMHPDDFKLLEAMAKPVKSTGFISMFGIPVVENPTMKPGTITGIVPKDFEVREQKFKIKSVVRSPFHLAAIPGV